MKIAIVGTGISGLTAAYVLHKHHEITVFEANENIGGHTATVDIQLDGKSWAIDTGFIVYNDWTYPNFIRLMTELGVKNLPTEMGFSVHCERTGFEYSGSSLGGLFAQRRNMFNPSFWRMLWDIMRFNKEAIADLDAGKIAADITLGEYLQSRGYGSYFVERYLVPMGAAIWSASTQMMTAFPLRFFVQFFKNHGLLSVSERPQWRVLQGGSRAYLAPITAPYRDRIKTSSPVTAIRRSADGVFLRVNGGEEQHFDQVIIAAHSDQALAMLTDKSAAEQQILGAIPYQANDVILHTDERMLPKAKAAWASWNYHLAGNEKPYTVLTYDMNILQRLASDTTFCVTLNNAAAIDPAKILRRFNYAHPVFTLDGIAAQQRWAEVNGVNNTWFCGAYWRNGFHEDGVGSALKVCEALGVTW